jgi:rhamnose utilization protein RhaD (predicted bifunctional aldolase and dehydrogenase)
MSKTASRLDTLVSLSQRLGQPELDYALLGEGNTSTRATDDTFYVKGSGYQLATIEAAGFAEVRFEEVLQLLEMEAVDDDTVRQTLAAARVCPQAPQPSVETLLHALLLRLPEVEFVAHTHPTAVNAILCSRQAAEAFSGRLFPDEIVCCGPRYVFIPLTDPGLMLARAVQEAVQEFITSEGQVPKVILMQNHGCLTLGPTVAAVENATLMLVKTARILSGTYALGGPQFLPPAFVERIQTRPDEKYREQLLKNWSQKG